MIQRRWTTVAEDDTLFPIYEKVRLRKRLDNLPHPAGILAKWQRDGDFTTVIVRAPHRRTLGEVIVDGASKRSMADKDREEVGIAVAFTKALESLDFELF